MNQACSLINVSFPPRDPGDPMRSALGDITRYRLRSTRRQAAPPRSGALAVLTAVLMVPLIGMLAFSIDIGYLLKKRAELQRAADSAALAAVRDLIPDPYGNQNLDLVRQRVRQYASTNITDVSGFTVLDSDITIGRYDPETIYTNVTILDDGIFDTVRVTLRRDGSANSPVPLLFGGIFGVLDSEVSATATAVLQKASIVRPGAGVLPFSIPRNEWNATEEGEIWSIYGNGRMVNPDGTEVPGNWGTLDLGTSSNSTADINFQVLNGLDQSHLDGLYNEGRVPSNRSLDSRQAFWANGDTGLSGGMKQSLQEVHGETKLIPIFDDSYGGGGGLEFHVTGWAVAVVHDTHFHGTNNTYVEIQKSYTYDGLLRPNRDLSITDGVIEGAYTSPVLVE